MTDWLALDTAPRDNTLFDALATWEPIGEIA